MYSGILNWKESKWILKVLNEYDGEIELGVLFEELRDVLFCEDIVTTLYSLEDEGIIETIEYPSFNNVLGYCIIIKLL